MRKLAVLLLASATVLAQDDGVSLFYKGFWLEQAEGKLDEAKALYGRLLAEKPDAPEAPRALLGLVRIKLARGEDAKDLVAELLRRYPLAKEEIEAAQRIAGARANSFAEVVRDTDSGVERKIKALYQNRLSGLQEADRTFLVDLGTVAHPMLSALLRDNGPGVVQEAAYVLLLQRTPEAHTVLARALLDDSVVFRAVIVEALGNCRSAPLVLVEALEKLYAGATPRLRAEVVKSLASMLAYEGDGRERVYAVLARALEDDDPAVRSAAVAMGRAPDAYVDTLLRRLEAKDPAMSSVYRHLPRLAERTAFRKRVEALFDEYAMDAPPPDPANEEAALLLARRVERELKAGNRKSMIYNLAYTCAGRSPKAAASLLLAAIELDDKNLVMNVGGGMGERERVQYLGDHAATLRAAALEAAARPGEKDGAAAQSVIAMLGLGPADFPVIEDALRRRGDRGMPAVLLDGDRLAPLGPAQAGALVSYCRDGKQVAALLHAGRRFVEREDAGVEFFRQVVPRAGPESAPSLRDLADVPALAPIVAERMLGAAGAEWGWTIEGSPPQPVRAERHPGPYVWARLHKEAFGRAPLQALLEARAEDPRFEIAIVAATVAAGDRSENGATALRKALLSKRPEARAIALRGLAARGPDGAAVVREFAARKDLTPDDRGAVGSAIRHAKDPAVTAVAAELLRQDPGWEGLWEPYFELAPKDAVDLALALPPTYHSMGVLVRADDPRRIEIFRAVLNGTDRSSISVVLKAVHDQYLVELGEETLSQLRSPDANVRDIATAAIEKLRFYAEAKKAFQK